MRLQVMMDSFSRIYGPRNRAYLVSLWLRTAFLNFGIADLEDAIRKNIGRKKLGVALARVVARTFCVAEYFGDDLPLIEMMSRKYPLKGCSYCRQIPCDCPEERPKCKLARSAAPEQMSWPLRNWCDHLDKLYGRKNRKRGIEYIVNRLFKEVAELQQLEAMVLTDYDNAKKINEAFAGEIADTLAWTIALSSVLKINLEKPVIYLYDNCWDCQRVPCQCGRFNFRQIDWSEIKAGQLKWE